jgi:hypothetical protein
MYDRSNFTSNVKAGLSATGSEESILHQGTSKSDGIMKTSTVFVSTSSNHESKEGV